MLSALLEASDAMGKKQELLSVKIKRDAYRKAKTAASWKGIAFSEYLSEIVLKQAERDCSKIGCDNPDKSGSSDE